MRKLAYDVIQVKACHVNKQGQYVSLHNLNCKWFRNHTVMWGHFRIGLLQFSGAYTGLLSVTALTLLGNVASARRA